MSNRSWWVVAIALGTLILLSLFIAPINSDLRRGSTYSRSPDGYGAWYASLQSQGIAVQRWQRPFEDLLGADAPASPITLLRVYPSLSFPFVDDEEWIEKGNVLILLGVRSLVTEAPFRSTLAGVKVETSRRADLEQSSPGAEQRLGDTYGAVVWERSMGRGKIIYAVTPHLAANAYQDEASNFKFLTQLVRQPGLPIWVDEYIHGYVDQIVQEQEAERDWVRYLARTPLSLLALQALVLLLVLMWGQNRRLGPAVRLTAPRVDNSEAYIQALGSVLNKAECSEFVLEVVGRAEQRHAQRSLGLGSLPVESDKLVQVWEQETGRPATELAEVLRPVDRKRRISERDLLIWLGKLQLVRRYLP